MTVDPGVDITLAPHLYGGAKGKGLWKFFLRYPQPDSGFGKRCVIADF